jgi:hypothetical protein
MRKETEIDQCDFIIMKFHKMTTHIKIKIVIFQRLYRYTIGYLKKTYNRIQWAILLRLLFWNKYT